MPGLHLRWTQVFVEYRIHDPGTHPAFFGTVDFCAIDGAHMTVVDFKYGAGITVEVVDNPQTRYYAYGMLLHPDAKDVKFVRRVICQPRIPWHPMGTVRAETDTADFLRQWAKETLVPAMLRTERVNDLKPGEWCRFCPAKLVCPALTAAYRAMAVADPASAGTMTDEQLDMERGLVIAVDMYKKAVNTEMLSRALKGRVFDSMKVVQQKVDRVFKEGAEERLAAEFGDKAYSQPKLLSPAQMEKVGPGAVELVKTWAYKPAAGFTLAPRSDSRAEIKMQSAATAFTEALAKMEAE